MRCSQGSVDDLNHLGPMGPNGAERSPEKRGAMAPAMPWEPSALEVQLRQQRAEPPLMEEVRWGDLGVHLGVG
eukprot:728682-Prorocentrum_minimum.AAC.1